MTAPIPAPSEAEIVRVLRAAGCVFAEEEAALLIADSTSPAELTQNVHRRVAGQPLEVILGWADFAGLRIGIEPGVFVPRRRSEYLVRRAIRLASSDGIVVDLCCGSGALGVAVATGVPGIRLYAADIEAAAVACARRNLAGIGEVFEGDLFDALPAALRGRVDLLLANAPYVPTDEISGMPPEARDYEPAITLDGGTDGLDVHRRVAADAAQWLAVGGTLVIETGRRQAPTAANIFRAAGLKSAVAHSRQRSSLALASRELASRELAVWARAVWARGPKSVPSSRCAAHVAMKSSAGGRGPRASSRATPGANRRERARDAERLVFRPRQCQEARCYETCSRPIPRKFGGRAEGDRARMSAPERPARLCA